MQQIDDISTHIQNITEMTPILADLNYTVPEKMIIYKILYSLPPSYNNIIATWSNILEVFQTIDSLEKRIFRYKSMIQSQGRNNIENDYAFFMQSTVVSLQPLNKKEQWQKDITYIKDLKARSKCYNCHDLGHW